MSRWIARRRYLTNFEAHRTPHLFTDALVIGSGVAGLSAALAAAENCDVLLITKDASTSSASDWAQGGVAAALPPDTPAAHAEDTLAVGGELCDVALVHDVVREGPRHIEQLMRWGARFDVEAGRLAVGLEGGHSAPRIIHAQGDATGHEMIRVLLEQVRRQPRIRVFEQCFAIDLLTRDGHVLGAVTHHPRFGHQLFWATTTILANGGFSRVYRECTGPAVCTGDGVAMAFRAGAVLRDLEMVQFHPTTLYVAGAARALISEAVRGAGGWLRNRTGERFMETYDPRAELAPRDVVSRAISSEMKRQHEPCVFLDVRHFAPGAFGQRFPNIARLCRDFDVDPARDLIPVRPAAHYTIGGVRTNAHAQTSVDGLLACGEVANCGLHGANRLASNSLLEGLVMGRRAGELAAQRAGAQPRRDGPLALSHLLPESPRTALDLDDVMHSLRSLMSRNAAIERSGDRLRETIDIVEFWSRYVMDKVFEQPSAWEAQNMLTVALGLACAAAMRCESRGTHFRSDHAEPSPDWRRHIEVRRGEEGVELTTTAVR